MESRHEILWPEVIHAWGNTREAKKKEIKKLKKKTLRVKGP